MKRKFTIILMIMITIFSVVILSSCDNTNTENKTIIAVSIVPEETFVKAVCGDTLEVITLIPSGSSPESYEPTVRQIEKFSKATLYFSIGVPTEEANILPIVNKNTKTISLADIVNKEYPDLTFESGERDPHIWLSPKRVKVMIEAIYDELSILMPENKALYRANADKFLSELDSADTEIKAATEKLKNKAFIVYHPAFGYLADEYGLTMYALEENGKEATIQRLQEMIDFAKENNIKVIFYQAEIDSSQSAAFAQEIGGKSAMLSPLSADYIENLKLMAKTIAAAIENE